MLEANKSVWFEKIFTVYNRNLFNRRFHSLRVSGLDFLRSQTSAKPLIIYANHSGWWDGLVAFEISRAAKLNAFIMMEEKQLKKLALFRKLGAFSVVRESPREAAKSIRYAVKLLKENTNRTLWIFPQGEILRQDLRPLNFYNGLSYIIKNTAECVVVPAAMRYEFFGNYKPEIFVKINSPEEFSTKNDFDIKQQTKHFEAKLIEALDNLKTDILTDNLQSYENII